MNPTLHKAAKFFRLLFKRRISFPHEIQIEVTNRCNLDCDMCPRLTVLGVPEIDMSEETFMRLVDNLRDPKAITLTGWGEPLMHPRFFDFVDILAKRFPQCTLAFTTNGFLLTEKVVEKILARPIARVTLSLEELPWEDGAKDHAKARSLGLDPKKGHNNALAVGGHPSDIRVVDNIRRLVESRGKVPEIRLQVVLMPEGEPILLRLIEFAAKEKLDRVNLVRLDVRGRPDLTRPDWQAERLLIKAAKAHAHALGLQIDTVNDHGRLMKMASHNDSFCMRLDDYVYVNVQGEVAACCLLRNKPVGSLHEQSLEDIWKSPGFEQYYGAELPIDCQGCDAFLHKYSSDTPAALSV